MRIARGWREHDGQTLGEVCKRLDMARQSATQHLDVLVRAYLVIVNPAAKSPEACVSAPLPG